MGTNSKASHQAYTTAPTAPTALLDEAPASTPLPPMAPVPTPFEDLEFEKILDSEAWQDTSTSPFESPPAPAPELQPTEDPPEPSVPEQTQVDPVPQAPADPAEPAVPLQTEAIAAAGDPQEGAEDEPDVVTPIPEQLQVGLAHGVPVLVGGEDLAESTATLVSYGDGEGSHEVLIATVTPDGESKLLDALSLSGTKMVPIQVQEQVEGRLPLDSELHLHELVAKAAKSVNHKMKTGVAIPQSTTNYIDAAEEAIAAATATEPNASPDDPAYQMVMHYSHQLEQVMKTAEAYTANTAEPYAAGGKIPQTAAYLHSGTVTVTKMVPAPDENAGPGKLSATTRDATRLQASIDPATGLASWDGSARSMTSGGSEYAIDLGDGYSAIYRPYGPNEAAGAEYSLRGQLEVHAPDGAGHAGTLVNKLGRLNLVNEPMSAAEGEYTYLKANISAQKLGAHPAVATATSAAGHVEELRLQELFHNHAHEAVGLDAEGLHAMAQRLQLQAARQSLPNKVTLMRDAVAAATGHADGAALAASPGYHPAPTREAGWLTWSRFDVTGQDTKFAAAWKGKSLAHSVTGANLLPLLTSGVLASTERRAIMGIEPGLGMSEHSDKSSGGANSVFLRVKDANEHYGKPTLIWDQPSALMSRSDYYAYNGDQYGAVNPNAGHSLSGQTTDPFKIAKFAVENNEVMFSRGIDLFGAGAPSRIVTGSAKQRTALLKLFADRGVTHLGGKPVADQIT